MTIKSFLLFLQIRLVPGPLYMIPLFFFLNTSNTPMLNIVLKAHRVVETSHIRRVYPKDRLAQV